MPRTFLVCAIFLGVAGIEGRLMQNDGLKATTATAIHRKIPISLSVRQQNDATANRSMLAGGPKPPAGVSPDALGESLEVYRKQKLLAASIMLVLCCAAAALYRHTKKDPEGVPNDGLEHKTELLRKWRFGLFDCFGDFKVCILSCFCPALRWADTMRMAGFLSFWVAFALLLILQVGSQLTAGLFSVVLLIVLIVYRQKQRQMFAMENGTCGSFLEDCLTYSCCACCAIVQEARHIEEAWVVEHPALPAPRLQ